MTVFRALAPSNIALVKYMGKEDAKVNQASNPSISMTLDRLCSVAEVEWTSGSEPEWQPRAPTTPEILGPMALEVPDLSPKGRDRILAFASRCLKEIPAVLARHGLSNSRTTAQNPVIRIANSFPAGVGIASSASSFAALTVVLGRAHGGSDFERAWNDSSALRQDFARLSKTGSGSSGRSMEGPWVHWDGDTIEGVASKVGPLVDHVLVIDRTAKAVGSSQAHERVRTSPLWSGRPERALQRAFLVREALREGAWPELCRLSWQEAWEMHSLFHTATPPFTYWRPRTVEVLNELSPWVDKASCLVTLDAGPNVHVLVPEAESPEWRTRLGHLFPGIDILSDRSGTGARCV